MDFIGIGAQKAATSWVYACLYEHPQICAPVKEIHFFSREHYENGQEWYESHVVECEEDTLRGEFSTSYLYHPHAAERINAMYPQVKIIAVIRNPVDRAYSQYMNAIKAGEIRKSVSFESYLRDEPSALEQGLYYNQLMQYYQYFSYKKFHLAIYDDIKKDPYAFVKALYEFLEIDPEFKPKMIKKLINTGRSPRVVFIEKVMHKVAEWMRRHRLGRLVWFVKTSGLTDAVRAMNTAPTSAEMNYPYDRQALVKYFKKDVTKLSELLQRDLNTEWNI